MGDERRDEEFSRFIKRNWPKVHSVLVVADGKGKLARRLANAHFQTRIIDPQPRLVGRKHDRIVYEGRYFSAEDQVAEQLIVGMHPDEATGEIVLAANRLQLPFAIVPCCIVGRESSGVQGYQQWLKKLKRLGQANEKSLRFNGRNIVLYRR